MATINKNEIVKAFSKWLSKNYRTEWEMAFNTNFNRGKVYDQYEFLDMFDRYGDNTDGCSKAVHLLKYIVVKRHQKHGYIPEIRNEYGTGNHLIDEINCYKRFNDKPEADLLCPIFKYFTSNNFVDIFSDVNHFFNFKTTRKKFIFQFFWCTIYINVIF